MEGFLIALMNLCRMLFYLASFIASTILSKDNAQYTCHTELLFPKSYWQYFWAGQCIMAENSNILDTNYNESSLFLRNEDIKYLCDNDYRSLKILEDICKLHISIFQLYYCNLAYILLLNNSKNT